MGSKSSSGSLMKSVESMLPKNMNMKHVLLAVLVGLLLCMLMGQTVESMTNIASTEMGDSGVCERDPFAPKDQKCVPGNFGTGANLSAAKAAAANGIPSGLAAAKLSKINDICNDISIDKCNNAANDEDAPIEEKSIIDTQFIIFDSDTSGSNKMGGATGKAYLKCKVEESDLCGATVTADGCKNMDACNWINCQGATGPTVFPFFGPETTDEGDSLDIDVDGTNYDIFRKCLFANNKTGATPTGAAKIRAQPQPSGEPTLGLEYSLSVPSGVGGTTTGKTLVGKNNTDTGKVDNNGPLASGKVPGKSGVAVNGLIGWLLKRPGIARNDPEMHYREWSPEQLRKANAIPLDEKGKVPEALGQLLPRNLKQGIEHMYTWCGYGEPKNNTGMRSPDGQSAGTVTLDKNVAVGWSDDLKGLKCLNYNPNIKQYTIQGHMPKFSCTDPSSQKCRLNSDNTESPTCKDDSGACYSFIEPSVNAVTRAPGFAKKLTAVGGVIADSPALVGKWATGQLSTACTKMAA